MKNIREYTTWDFTQRALSYRESCTKTVQYLFVSTQNTDATINKNLWVKWSLWPLLSLKHSIQYIVHVTDSWLPYNEIFPLIILLLLLSDMSTECKCYRLELQSKMAQLASRCVHTSSDLAWIMMVNEDSCNKISHLRLPHSWKGPHLAQLLLSTILFFAKASQPFQPFHCLKAATPVCCG